MPDREPANPERQYADRPTPVPSTDPKYAETREPDRLAEILPHVGTYELRKLRSTLNAVVPSDPSFLGALATFAKHILDREVMHPDRLDRDKADKEKADKAAADAVEAKAKADKATTDSAAQSQAEAQQRAQNEHLRNYMPVTPDQPPRDEPRWPAGA